MKVFDDVVNFHGHACPGLAIGYRVARRAMEELSIDPSKDEEIVAIVENDSCAVDAVQVLTGCTFGKGNLIFRDHGKQVYTFIKRDTGESVRISVDFTFPEESQEEKRMWQRYREGERSDDVLEVVHKRKAKKIEYILDAPDESIMTIRRMILKPPSEARIYRSVGCGMCGEKVSEHRARVFGGKIICTPCFNKITGRE